MSFPALAPWLTLHGLIIVVAVLVYVISSHVMHQRRQPAAAIAWMLFILLMPYLALPAFLTFGSRKLQRPASMPRSVAAQAGEGAWAVETIAALGQPAPAAYSALDLHADGRAAKAALLEIIDRAEHSIDLCTFIIGTEGIGDTVLDRLCARAASGVAVRLMVDGLGRLMEGRRDLKRIVDAGGALAVFVPPLHSPLKGRTNLRDHRKLLVADADHDGRRLWCGGRNLADEYFEGVRGAPPWRDLSFDLRGPLVLQASRLFAHDWAFARGEPWVPEDAALQAARPGDVDGAQLVASGPDQVDDTVYSLLVTAAYRAQSRIALVTPYFVPDVSLVMALSLAARRGVAVDLLLPARSNHRLSDFARNRALRTLALAGGRVWLASGMLHAKLAVFDDTLALAGSANLDSRSLFLNYELMMAFHKDADVRRFADWFEAEKAPATRYVAKRPGLVRDIAEGMLLWLGFQL